MAVLTTFEVVEIFFRLVDEHVGHLDFYSQLSCIDNAYLLVDLSS